MICFNKFFWEIMFFDEIFLVVDGEVVWNVDIFVE